MLGQIQVIDLTKSPTKPPKPIVKSKIPTPTRISIPKNPKPSLNLQKLNYSNSSKNPPFLSFQPSNSLELHKPKSPSWKKKTLPTKSPFFTIDLTKP